MTEGKFGRHIPEAMRRRLILEEWHNRKLPEDAFSDDPRADGHDKNGRVTINSRSNSEYNRWDLGRFPPND